MPIQSRQPDFLASHTRLERRVSNLETGVHPTRANVEYHDSYDPTEIPVDEEQTVFDPPGGSAPSWSRRSGMVYLGGKIEGPAIEDIPSGGARYGTIPPPGRPSGTTVHIAGVDGAVSWIQVKIEEDGDLIVMPPTSGTGAFEVSLETIAYPFD